jgi:hypothetical protein
MPETKKRPGRWKAGESGNPKGRKPGTGEVAKFRSAIADQVPEILNALIGRALEGDIGAARLLLERTVAPLKAVEPTQRLRLPDGSLTDKGQAVLASVAAGELAPSQGATLLGALGTLAKLVEFEQIEARIAALEQQYAGAKK